MVRVVAIEPHNTHGPGDDYLATEREARQLIAKRLVRMAIEAPRNKMLPPPLNKRNPSPDDGQGQPSSPSRRAPVSPPTTAPPSESGVQAPRTPAKVQIRRRRHSPDASLL
jgi:hypothetical protein